MISKSVISGLIVGFMISISGLSYATSLEAITELESDLNVDSTSNPLRDEEVSALIEISKQGDELSEGQVDNDNFDYKKIEKAADMIINKLSKDKDEDGMRINDSVVNEIMSNEEVAELVMMGKYGNGNQRRLRLEAEGYIPSEIQDIIKEKTISVSKVNVDKASIKEEVKLESEDNSKGILMNATAYSRNEVGLGNITANGTDLRNISNVIAVDPKVIPLGSKVEIEGLGMYIAADTGGAIKGNKIDIHFESVNECLEFGRKAVNVKILN